MKKISQREAQRNRKELRRLQLRDYDRSRIYLQDYPGGVEIARVSNDDAAAIVLTARKLGHTVVCTAVEQPSGTTDQVILFGVMP